MDVKLTEIEFDKIECGKLFMYEGKPCLAIENAFCDEEYPHACFALKLETSEVFTMDSDTMVTEIPEARLSFGFVL